MFRAVVCYYINKFGAQMFRYISKAPVETISALADSVASG